MNEVKKEVETLNVDINKGVDPNEEPEIEGPESSTETSEPSPDNTEEQPKEQPKEEPKEETPEEKPKEEPRQIEEPSKPKPVEGETPQVYAMRKTIEKLREDKRQLKKEKSEIPVEKPDYSDLKDNYTDEELKNSEKLIKSVIDKQGYVKKEEVYQQTTNDTLQAFIEDYPVYKPAQDPDNLRWDRFQEILYADYNVNGKSSLQLKSIFEKVNRDVESELGSPTRNQNQINAQQQKIKSVSHTSGGSTKNTSEPKKQVSPEIQKMMDSGQFKGFSEDDFSEDNS